MSRDTIRARVAASTDGPWVESGRDVDHDRFVSEGKNPGSACGLGCEVEGPPEPMLRGQFDRHADAVFVAHARQDIPALLAVADAAAAICFGDLRDDFEDGQDIVLRWTGNRSDWQALRAALDALEALP